MSYFTHGVAGVWCGECPVWRMSGVMDVLFHKVWWMSDVVDVLFYIRCGGYLVWWMSGVVDVWCDGCLV